MGNVKQHQNEHHFSNQAKLPGWRLTHSPREEMSPSEMHCSCCFLVTLGHIMPAMEPVACAVFGEFCTEQCRGRGQGDNGMGWVDWAQERGQDQ